MDNKLMEQIYCEARTTGRCPYWLKYAGCFLAGRCLGKEKRGVLLAALIVGFILSSTASFAQMLQMIVHDTSASGGGGSYVGPEDVVAGPTYYFGLRAPSAAAIGGALVTLERASDNTTQSFSSVSGGGIDAAGIATFCNATTCGVSVLGSLLTQSTFSRMPSYTASCLNGHPCMVCNSAATTVLVNASLPAPLASSLPLTIVATVINTSSTAGLFGGSSGGHYMQIEYAETANQFSLFNGSRRAYGSTTGTGSVHSVAWVFGASTSTSQVYVDGVAGSTGDGGTDSPASVWAECAGPAGSYINGDIMEVLIYPSALTATQISNLSANQLAYW